MRTLRTTLLYMIMALTFSVSALAQPLSSKGTWAGKTINSNTSPGTRTPVIEVEDDITLTGEIIVSSGYTLTIRNVSGKEITIQKTFSAGEAFTVASGGTLIIEGASESERIVIDCGAKFTWNDYTLTPAKGSLATADGIYTSGSLSLKYVTIRNFSSVNSYHGAINVSSTPSPTTIDHCIIENCQSGAGAAIMINNTNNTDPETCKVTVSNSLIQRCVTGNSGTNNSGGAIRTLGNVVSSLHLVNVTFHQNYARRNPEFNNTLEKCGNGAALFWNGRGKEATTCHIDGCTFTENKCDDNGGAIKTQGSIIFENNVTTISGNTAPFGAGIFIEGYTGSVKIGKPCTLTYDLNENLVITGNTAVPYTYNGKTYPGKGAGIHFDFGSDMKLDKKSTINVILEGATISGNKVEGEGGLGGGIFYEDLSPADSKYVFNINMNYGTISGNSASAHGGGIYVSKGNVTSAQVEEYTLEVSGNSAENGAGIYIKDGSLSMANGTITTNIIEGTGNGGGIYIENGNFTIGAGEVSSNTIDGGLGAGVYIKGSNGLGKFTMDGGEIKNNSTEGNNGGGVYVDGGNFLLNNGSITGNNAVDGGGVYLNNGNFELVLGEISGNTASGYGGGVYLIGQNCIYKLKDGSIHENVAEIGGGVYLANGSFILADNLSNTGTISQNSATGGGGGVFIAGSGNFTMNGGTVQLNTVNGNKGGGIFLNGGNFTLNNGDIMHNSSTAEGGGVYLLGGKFIMNSGTISGNSSDTDGGGVFLDGGELEVSAGNISTNAAQLNGGGVYIMNGTVNMGSGIIKTNWCGEYGGGVYVYNSSESDKKTVNFEGGTLMGNTARFGGGICVNGLIDMTVDDIEIAENVAINGGGVCLMNNAYMAFKKGEIKNNLAKKESMILYSTGYGVPIDQIEGLGGGVYLDSDTRLHFSTADQLGLFGNIAHTGGNEIFAKGQNTEVDLPDVTDMAIKGYTGGENLKWIEDYPTNDIFYYKGTKLKGDAWDTDMTNLRYEDTILENGTIYNLTGAVNKSDKYICFALGYEIIYITITRHGLAENESAIYTLTRSDGYNFSIIMTGDGSEYNSKMVAVTAGDWSIKESDWSWAYKLTDMDDNVLANRTISKNVADMNNRHFEFVGTRLHTLSTTDEHEDVLINIR